ncbi:hypothetical protein BaRGS_00016134 [Batillaria attramentaria]|uniref:Uncharacterized protein n=1 Tax=Batillaria attramentaria TaxID=370345 RepID=A0ABD0L0L0_9CAEN
MACTGRLFVIFLASFSGCLAALDKRDVTTEFYPDCDEFCKAALNQSTTTGNFSNLVYVRAAGQGGNSGDVLHYVLSTVNVPSILMVHTEGDKNAKLNFNWERLLMGDNITDMADAITTNTTTAGNVRYSFAVVFTKLLEYDDQDDSANVNASHVLWNIRNFTEFQWMNATTGQNGHSVIFNTTSSQPSPAENKTSGSLSFEFELNHEQGRDDDLPRLLFNANNTQINFVLDKFVPSFNKSRFALEVVMVSQETSDSMYLEETKSIDDEYSPGVFRVVNWYTMGSHRHDGGYLQYKPVCYMKKERSRASGTETSHYALVDPMDFPDLGSILNISLARAFFGNQSVVRQSTNVSFGLSQDGFYVKNNYTAWTASVGYGAPPDETISLLVIIIIAAGLGIPVVLIIFGGIYVCVRKLRSRRGYRQMDNVADGGRFPPIN